MSQKFYDGEEHIFYNDAGNDVYIKSLEGQNLYIEGIFTGGKVEGYVNTNDLDFNEIYRGTGPDVLTNSYTADGMAMGSDVSISSTNVIASACPLYIFGASKGGVSVYSDPAGGWDEYSSLLPYTSVTTEATVNHCSVDSLTGEWIGLTDGADGSSSADFYRNIAGTWVFQDNISDCYVVKVSDGYALVCNKSTVFRTLMWDGFNWVEDQPLDSYGAPTIPHQPMFLSRNVCGFWTSIGGFVVIYRRISGTWLNNLNIVMANVLDLQGFTGDFGESLIVILTGTQIHIYEDFVLSQSLSFTNGNKITTNGEYIFVNTSTGRIYVIGKKDGVWQFSENYTEFVDASIMSCNANYLVVGNPFYRANIGSSNVYKIEDYNDSVILSNVIDLSEKDLKIESLYGDVVLSGQNVITKDGLKLNNGDNWEPSLSFENDTDTGLYLNTTGQLGVSVSGTPIQIHKNTEIDNLVSLKIPEGSLSNLSMKFDNGTGIYKFGLGTSFVSEGFNIGTLGPYYSTFLSMKTSNCYGIASGNGVQSVPTGIVTVLTDAYYNNGASIINDKVADRLTYLNGVFTVGMTGMYFVSYEVNINAVGSGTRRSRVLINGSTTYATQSVARVTADWNGLNGSAIIPLNIGDTISTALFQDSVGSLDTNASMIGRFIVYRLG